MRHRRRKTHQPALKGIRANFPTILLQVTLLFSLIVARVIYSPLLPSIEGDLHLNHTQATSFFLIMTLGYITMNLFSGYLASWLSHRAADPGLK